MKLAIDIGNTSTTCGVFEDSKLIKKFDIASPKFLQDIFNNQNITIDKTIISSVVPTLTRDYKKIIENQYSCSVFIINHKNSNLILKVKQPETVGSDRLCNIYATIKLYQVPAIIVDFGTATTFDVINSNQEFIGGSIAAGVETSANYLIDKAALLPKTLLKFPAHSIGIDTQENIQSGIMFGAIDQVEGMIKRISKETKTNYNIILSGGFSKLLSSHLSINHFLDIDLTLKGMIYIYNMTKE